GANHKQFQFTYDHRHQLVGTTETTTPGYFSAAYDYNEAGRFKTATETASGAPGSNVLPRNVAYRYAAFPGEEEQDLAIEDRVTNAPLVSYEYDLAGNQTLRCQGVIALGVCQGESLSFLYDGLDRLRRVTKQSDKGRLLGTEEYWYDSDG